LEDFWKTETLGIIVTYIVKEAYFKDIFRIEVAQNLDLRERKKQETGEKDIMKSFIICKLHKISLG
jgi:hypothetical protein